jgi:hypothetical protein
VDAFVAGHSTGGKVVCLRGGGKRGGGTRCVGKAMEGEWLWAYPPPALPTKVLAKCRAERATILPPGQPRCGG